MGTTTLPATIADPARSRAAVTARLELESELRAVLEHVERFMAGDAARTPAGQPIALVDALDALTRGRQHVEALNALGRPDLEALANDREG